MEKTDEQYKQEINDAYADARVIFLKGMIKEGRSQEYIEGRLKWLDEMYGDSLRNIKNIMDSSSDEGCEI